MFTAKVLSIFPSPKFPKLFQNYFDRRTNATGCRRCATICVDRPGKPRSISISRHSKCEMRNRGTHKHANGFYANPKCHRSHNQHTQGDFVIFCDLLFSVLCRFVCRAGGDCDLAGNVLKIEEENRREKFLKTAQPNFL